MTSAEPRPRRCTVGSTTVVKERDDISASIAVDELAHRLAREQQFVAALVGSVHDLEIVVGHGREGTGGERSAYEPSR